MRQKVCFVLSLLSLLVIASGANAQKRMKAQKNKVITYENVCDSLLLYGLNYHSEYSDFTLAPGIYSFHSARTVRLENENAGKTVDNAPIACYGKGKFYTFNTTSDFLTGSITTTLNIYNADTWELLGSHQWENTAFQQAATYDPLTNKIYAFKPAIMAVNIVAIDLSTYAIDSIATDEYNVWTALTAAPDGKLYAISATDYNLYSIDKTTGAFKAVGPVNEDMNTGVQASCVDWATGKMYRVGPSDDSSYHLYTTDLSTGTTTLIGNMPTECVLSGLYIPYTEPNAPAAAQHIQFDYKQGGSQEATLSFTIPQKTYDGKALTEQLAYTVTIDGISESTAVNPGDNISLNKTFTPGSHSIQIRLSNTAGQSPLRKFTTFTGSDVPAKVQNVALDIEPESREASLTWNTPTQTIHGGYIDESSIRYKIIREPNDVEVSSSQSDTTFTETLSDAYAHYYYKVIAMSNDQCGDTAVSNSIVSGDSNYPPFVETFSTADDYNRFKVTNYNKDGYGWQYYGENAFCMPSGKMAENYGLLTPAIVLGNTQYYKMSFKARCNGSGKERLAITIGKEDDLMAHKTLVMDTLSITNEESDTYSAVFKVSEPGKYYIGFHAISPIGSPGLELDDIAMAANASVEAPEGVNNLSVTPGSQGALTAQLSFKAPTQNGEGKTLSSLTKIEIYKADANEPAYTFENPETGNTYSWTDTEATQGFNKYRVIAFNEKGNGKEVGITSYIGIDVPESVKNLNVVPDELHAKIQWKAPSAVGSNKGYVDVSSLKYRIKRYDNADNSYGAKVVAEDLTETNFVDTSYHCPANRQQGCVKYEVNAYNEIGDGAEQTTLATLGKPYDMPYQETFANNQFATGSWNAFKIVGTPQWKISNGLLTAVKPIANDGGMLVFRNAEALPTQGIMRSPSISMKGSKQPELSFYMYHGSEAEEGDLNLKIKVLTSEGVEEQIATVEYNNGKSGWMRHSIPLSDFKASGSVILCMEAYAADASASIYLDNVQVSESLGKDLAVAYFNAASRTKAKESNDMTVGVINMGNDEVDSYKVDLIKDGVVIASKAGSRLAKNDMETVTFNGAASIFDAGKEVHYQAVVNMEGDENVLNDSSSIAKTFVNGPKYPKIMNLKGTKEQTSVRLSWSKPSTSMQAPVTDTFESYTPFIIENIGNWTTYDGDKQNTNYFLLSPSIANKNAPQAWQVWNREAAQIDSTEALASHSGKQYLISWSAVDWMGGGMPNDNWLISPAVIGGSDVSFWSKEIETTQGPEMIELLYSSTDSKPESFSLLLKDSLTTSTWLPFEYTLPDDAKYFAIHSCTQTRGFATALDDVTYTPQEGTKTELVFKGFNIYRDNQLLAENVTDSTYTDKESGTDSHTYYVTTVWDMGESMISNEYVSSPGDGLAGLNSQNVKVFAGNKAIILLNGDAKVGSIFTLDGKTVFSAPLDKQVSVSVPAGVYIVRVGTTTYKVLVK